MGGLRRWGLWGTGDASLAIDTLRDCEDGTCEPAGEVPGLRLRISRGLEDIGINLWAHALQRNSLSLDYSPSLSDRRK
jgi:hypothetical protein